MAPQAGAAAASIGTFIHISQRWQKPYKPKDVREANVLRFGVQWPATIIFWGAYLASYAQGRKQWKKRPLKAARLDIQIGPEVVVFSARFPVL